MINDIREYLIDLAIQGGKTITYKDLCGKFKMGFDTTAERNKLFSLLENITRTDFNEKSPFLTINVVRGKDGKVGKGFYELCEILKYNRYLKFKPTGSFEELERKYCAKYWRDQRNHS
jgi:hypothetical protein